MFEELGMTRSVDELLDRLARQAVGAGVESSLFHELVENPPDAGRFTALVADVVPRASNQGRFGIAELALNLVDRGSEYRQAAEIAIEGADFTDFQVVTLSVLARGLQGDDVLWWHDLFCRPEVFPGDRKDLSYRELIVAHGPHLLRERQAAVLEYLLVPDRGPGSNNVFAFDRVIALLDGCPPLERRWAEWIRAGRFEGIEGRQAGDEHPRTLGHTLARGLARRPAVYDPLLAEALARWHYLLTSGDEAERRRGLNAIRQLVEDGVTFDRRLVYDVVDHLDPDLVPETTTAAMREAVLAAWRVEQVEKRNPDDYPRVGAAERVEPAVAEFADLVLGAGAGGEDPPA
jgi:hypothetical protein